MRVDEVVGRVIKEAAGVDKEEEGVEERGG